MTDLATIRIPVDSSDMVQAVRESKNLERGIKMLVDAFDAGAIGSSQLNNGLSQLRKEFQGLFTNYQQATSRVRGFASALLESKAAADAAANSKQNLAEATKRAETAFALANQKAKEELQTLRNRAEFAFAMAMQRERESAAAVRAAEEQAKAEQKLAQEIVKRRAAEQQSVAQGAQAFQSQIGVNLGLGAQGVSASASASAMEAEIERLRQKYDGVYAASRLYESSLQELNRAHMLNVTSIEQYKAAVEQLNMEYQAFQNGTANTFNRFSQGVQQTGVGMNNAGVLIQQLGYQAGDFAVQVQSGTSAFVAFGQQATQLVGFLPMLAQELNIAKVAFMGMSIPIAPLMLGLSILIPTLTALGAYFSRTSEESANASEKLGEFEQRVDSLRQSLDDYSRTKEALARGITVDEALGLESYDQALNAFVEAERKLAEIRASSALPLASTGVEMIARIIRNKMDEKAAVEELTKAEEERAMAKEVLEKISERMLPIYEEESRRLAFNSRLEEARLRYGEESLTVKDLELEAERRSYEESLKRLPLNEAFITSLMNQYDQLVRNKEELEASRQKAESFRDALLSASNIDLSSVFSFAQGPLDALVQKATELFTKMAAIAYIESNQQGGTNFLANQYRMYGEGRAAFDRTARESSPLFTPFPVPQEVSGGGGRQAQLRKEIQLVRELTQAEEERQTILGSIESSLENGFMSMVDGTKSVKDAFRSMAAEIIKELYRVLVVQRMVGTYDVATGVGTGIVGAIGAAFSGGAGAATVGGFRMTGGMRASGGSIMPNQSYLVGENGPELVIPRHSGTVVNANQTSAMGSGGNGTTVVNNNISVTGSDAAMVRAEVVKMIPQITNATKAAVIDARLRGGQMKAAFS